MKANRALKAAEMLLVCMMANDNNNRINQANSLKRGKKLKTIKMQ